MNNNICAVELTAVLPKGIIIDSKEFLCNGDEEAAMYCKSLNKVITENDFIQTINDYHSGLSGNPVFYNYDWSFKDKLDFTSNYREKYGNCYACVKNLTGSNLIAKVRNNRGIVCCAIIADGRTVVVTPGGYLAKEREYKRYQGAVVIDEFGDDDYD